MVEDIIIDVVGSFSDGKTTLVRALTSESTLRHSEERKRGITIRLGYAHFMLYKCVKCASFSRNSKCEVCGGEAIEQRRVSIIDSPGHKTLMTIMLSGAALASGAILVIAANQKCPQPQTLEHLETLKIMGVKNLVVAQTKVDVIGKERAKENKAEIEAFMKSNGFEGIKIIPVFSIHDVNIVELLQEVGRFSAPKASSKEELSFLVVRSFDVNKPGTPIKELGGGVLGGALKNGGLKVGDKITIYPGVFLRNVWEPLKTKVVQIQSEFGSEKEIHGGLTVGVKTSLDPSITRRDGLAGSLATFADKPPILKSKINIMYSSLTEREKTMFKKPLQKNEIVLINVLASKVLGTVFSVSGDKVAIIMNNNAQIPCYNGDKAVISRKLDNVWVLSGSGLIYD